MTGRWGEDLVDRIHGLDAAREGVECRRGVALRPDVTPEVLGFEQLGMKIGRQGSEAALSGTVPSRSRNLFCR